MFIVRLFFKVMLLPVFFILLTLQIVASILGQFSQLLLGLAITLMIIVGGYALYHQQFEFALVVGIGMVLLVAGVCAVMFLYSLFDRLTGNISGFLHS